MGEKKQKNSFFHGGNWKDNAVLFWGIPTFYSYIEGYFYSANVIAASMLRDDFISSEYRSCKDDDGNELFNVVKDECIFPMIFLYRHYIELSLKHLLQKIYILNQLPEKIYDEQKHVLEGLLEKFRTQYSELEKKIHLKNKKEMLSYQQAIKSLYGVCKDIDEIDCGSLASRYPTDINGDCYLQNSKPVNVTLFMEKMQNVHKILTWGDYMLEALLEHFNDADI